MLKRQCPFLGLSNDPDTIVGFPSLRNRCHRIDSTESVRPEYQRSHCLTFNHRNCPVLLGEADSKLVAEITVVPWKRRTVVFAWGVASVFAIIVVSIILFGGWQWAGAIDGSRGTESKPAQQVAPPTQTVTSPSLTPTEITIAVPAATEVLPTNTLLPTGTPEPTSTATQHRTSTSTPATVQPTSCGAPAGWVVYTVQVGDTLSSIAATHGITLTQLQTANCLTSTEIYVGQQLYVPGESQATQIPTLTATEQATEVPPPTATRYPTDTPSPSDTSDPTLTPFDTSTNTPIPSPTPFPTITDTPVPSNTAVPPPTATSTPITLPPTATPEP